MAKMNGTGPEDNGQKTGRGIGQCESADKTESLEKLGKGMGLRRHSGGGQGKGKRLKNNKKHKDQN